MASNRPNSSTRDSVDQAVAALEAGACIGLPTETVYGLAADATNAAAVARIFELKGRPRFNPLIAHVSDMAMAQREGIFPEAAQRLAQGFWPGALSLVVPRRPDTRLSDLCSAGLATQAFRVPAHPLARAVIEAFGRPLAAPSANRSGHVSPTTAAHVRGEFSKEDVPLVLDGGPAEVGLESTIVGFLDGQAWLLRPGGIPRAEIEALIGPLRTDAPDTEDAPHAPGRLLRHYAPHTPVRLNARDIEPGEALLAFGPNAPSGAAAMVQLSKQGDLREAAAGLFAGLRRLDAVGARAIAVMPIPDEGLGEAINDRLRRAAAGRG